MSDDDPSVKVYANALLVAMKALAAIRAMPDQPQLGVAARAMDEVHGLLEQNAREHAE